MNDFNKLDLNKDILKNLEDLKFTQMTEIQKMSLPYALQKRYYSSS